MRAYKRSDEDAEIISFTFYDCDRAMDFINEVYDEYYCDEYQLTEENDENHIVTFFNPIKIDKINDIYDKYER